MKRNFSRIGVGAAIAVSMLFCSYSQAGVVIDVSSINGAYSNLVAAPGAITPISAASTLGTVSVVTPTAPAGTDVFVLTHNYTLSGVNLTAEGGSASESITFDVVLSAFVAGGTSPGRHVNIDGAGNIGIANGENNNAPNNTQISGNESFNISIGNFGTSYTAGTLSFDGFTEVTLQNFGNAADNAEITFADGTIANLVGNNDPGTSTGPIFDQGGTAFGGNSATFLTNGTNNESFSIRFLDLQFTATEAVPEPSSLALLGLAAFGVVARRKRS